jgi:CBS domain-containing protein
MSMPQLKALDDWSGGRPAQPGPAVEPATRPAPEGRGARQPDVPPPPAPVTVADVMRPSATTVADTDHVAAAADLMKHAHTAALLVLDAQHAARPVGIITEADVAQAVADGKDVNEVRIRELMTTPPETISAAASIRDAAETMLAMGLRQLPVADGETSQAGLIGIVDIADVCGALLGLPPG